MFTWNTITPVYDKWYAIRCTLSSFCNFLEPEIIGFFVPKDDRTVLITNFSAKTSEDDLFEIVSQYGPVYKCMSRFTL